MFFGWLKDPLKSCIITILSPQALRRKNNDNIVKKAVFGAKSSEIAHTNTALAAKGANYFSNVINQKKIGAKQGCKKVV
jgi:hypothetical protein